jgi:hypothetical protein
MHCAGLIGDKAAAAVLIAPSKAHHQINYANCFAAVPSNALL